MNTGKNCNKSELLDLHPARVVCLMTGQSTAQVLSVMRALSALASATGASLDEIIDPGHFPPRMAWQPSPPFTPEQRARVRGFTLAVADAVRGQEAHEDAYSAIVQRLGEV